MPALMEAHAVVTSCPTDEIIPRLVAERVMGIGPMGFLRESARRGSEAGRLAPGVYTFRACVRSWTERKRRRGGRHGVVTNRIGRPGHVRVEEDRLAVSPAGAQRAGC